MSNKYYLYCHIRPDLNVPFYIGIGSKQRSNWVTLKQEYQRAFSTFTGNKGRTNHWLHVYNKCGKKIEVEILFESDTWAEIVQKEVEFIKLYGRKDTVGGLLVNLTDGGDGAPGHVLSEEHKAKIKKANSQRLIERNKANIGKKLPPHVVENMRAAQLGRVHSEEARKKMSLSMTGVKKPPRTKEHIEKIRLKHLGKQLSSEAKKKISEKAMGHKRNVGRKHSEESKARMTLAQMGNKNSLGVKRSDQTLKNMSVAAKKRWDNYREKKYANQLTIL